MGFRQLRKSDEEGQRKGKAAVPRFTAQGGSHIAKKVSSG
jgi:hypothetical protein